MRNWIQVRLSRIRSAIDLNGYLVVNDIANGYCKFQSVDFVFVFFHFYQFFKFCVSDLVSVVS